MSRSPLQSEPIESAGRDKVYQRLEHLYEISKCLADIESVEETFARTLTLVAETFPLRSAVLVEAREDTPYTTIWPTTGLSRESVRGAIEHARSSYAYLRGSTISQTAALQAEPATTALLRGEGSKPKPYEKEGTGNFLVFPLVVGRLPIFGALQLEGLSPLAEEDVRFADALTNLIAVSLDRYRRAQKQEDLRQGKIREGAARLTQSQDHVMDLKSERNLREQFVSTLSHDLRTPLTAARLSAQLIFRQVENFEVSRDLASKIVGHIDRMDQMIRDLLDANQIRAGERLHLKIDRCDLRALIADTLEMLGTVHGDRFVIEAEETSVWGYWSPDGLRRVVENLASNAIKYGYPHRAVTFGLKQTKQDVLITVHNEGEPIPSRDQASLFQQFKRTRSAQTGGQSGWGLGLALVQGIAEAHGGKAWVESEPGRGTTFAVQLPNDARVSQEQATA